MKITVVGLSGSGKTTLAKKISEKLKIQHIHLDRFWFEEGGKYIGKKTTLIEKERIRAAIKKRVLSAVSKDSWVSDGFYSRIQDDIAKQADIVIFLDIPLWKRLINNGVRILSPGEHKELSIWDQIKFFPEIIRRHLKHKPKITEFITRHKSKVVQFKNYKETQSYLQKLI